MVFEKDGEADAIVLIETGELMQIVWTSLDRRHYTGQLNAQNISK